MLAANLNHDNHIPINNLATEIRAGLFSAMAAPGTAGRRVAAGEHLCLDGQRGWLLDERGELGRHGAGGGGYAGVHGQHGAADDEQIHGGHGVQQHHL